MSTCPQCRKSFSRYDILIRHRQTCSGLAPISINEPQHPPPLPPPATDRSETHDIRAGPSSDRSVINAFDNVAVRPLSSHHQEGRASPHEERRSSNKRGCYVSKACASCQKRKVKCSGETPCRQCRTSELDCVYRHGRKRRKTTIAHQLREVEMGEEPSRIFDALQCMMARISSVERECTILNSRFAGAPEDNLDEASRFESALGLDEQNVTIPDIQELPVPEKYRGTSALLDSIRTLNRTVARTEDDQDDSRPRSPGIAGKPDFYWRNLAPPGLSTSVNILEMETRSIGISELRESIKTFFLMINPHYPCLNENAFRAEFETFIQAKRRPQVNNADRYQFLVLVNLIQAEVKLLSHQRSDSNEAPAWNEFCRAESILNRLTWLGHGNLLTVQCLMLKARYLFYLEKGSGAYDTICRVVRLMAQLGLHNQALWAEADCSPFDTVIRQRIFWSAFCLERNISFNCGYPYLFKEGDYKVDFPRDYDDLLLFPNQPLPNETPQRSFSPYLRAAAKWGKLCSDMWDTLFGPHAQKPTDQEAVFSLDARTQYTVSQLPVHLQWQQNASTLEGSAERAPFILRQSLMLHLRMNQLRSLLRQERILSMQYNEVTARESVSIATSTIDAIHSSFFSETHAKTGRFESCLYLLVALLPLVCIIVKGSNSLQMRAEAIDAFKKGRGMLDQMTPSFGCARHASRRIHRIFATTKRAIHSFQEHESMMMFPNNNFELRTLDPPVAESLQQHLHLMAPDNYQLDQLFNCDIFAQSSGPRDVDPFWVSGTHVQDHSATTAEEWMNAASVPG